jgi:type II secretory pathway component PulJ
MRPAMRRVAGIGLIEVMIAMMLMALVGVMAERGLSQMLRARDAVAAEQQRWRNIAFAFGRFSEDVSSAATGIPNETPLVMWQGEGDSLRWARWSVDGLVLPIRYELTLGQLQRFADAATNDDATAAPVVLLEKVTDMQIQLLDSRGAWHKTWPADGVSDSRPRAVSMTLTLQEGVKLQRIFALP